MIVSCIVFSVENETHTFLRGTTGLRKLDA